MASVLDRPSPQLEPDPDGGQVVITRFECPNRLLLAALILLHFRVKREVRRNASGFVGVKMIVSWRRRLLLSISVWDDLASVYSMGRVDRHIRATRLPGRVGIRTTSGVFCYVGDWRRVMFASDVSTASPLDPVRTPTKASERPKEVHHAYSD